MKLNNNWYVYITWVGSVAPSPLFHPSWFMQRTNVLDLPDVSQLMKCVFPHLWPKEVSQVNVKFLLKIQYLLCFISWYNCELALFEYNLTWLGLRLFQLILDLRLCFSTCLTVRACTRNGGRRAGVCCCCCGSSRLWTKMKAANLNYLFYL